MVLYLFYCHRISPSTTVAYNLIYIALIAILIFNKSVCQVYIFAYQAL